MPGQRRPSHIGLSQRFVSIWRRASRRIFSFPAMRCAHVVERAHCSNSTRPPMYLPHGWASPPFRIDDVTKRSRDPHCLSRWTSREGSCVLRPLVQEPVEYVPTRGCGYHGGTTQRESASRCVPVRACALPNNISTASPSPLTLDTRNSHPLLSLFLRVCIYIYVYISLSFSLIPRSVRCPRVEAFASRSPSSAPISTDLTKAREEKNHAAEQHVCCTRADRQARWL